jgi:hypothetical protein
MSDAGAADHRPWVLAIVVFALLWLAAAATSTGFLEMDACTHYLYARFAFQHPGLLINIWGRPICTGLYAIPAMLGHRMGVQITSLLTAIACAGVAYQIARGQGLRWPALALIFTLGQPLVFLHSFSEMTELPFALMIGGAVWAYQKRQWLVMAIIIAWTPLSRPEGFGFLFLAALVLIAHRRAWWILVLPMPLILWSYCGWRLSGREGQWWRWIPENWPFSTDSVYASGSIFHFLLLLPVVTSSILLPFTLLGIWRNLASWKRISRDFHAEVNAVIAAVPLMILAGHSVLYAAGKMASNGEVRYMLVATPLWGLLAAGGWEWVFTRLNGRHPFLWAGAAALAPIIANLAWGVVPIKADESLLQARHAANWYISSGISSAFPRLGAAHPAIFFYLDRPLNDHDRGIDWRRDTLSTTPPGTLLIFDPVYPLFNADEKRKVTLENLHDAGWIDVTDQVPSLGQDWHVLLSPKTASGADAQDILHSLSTP